MLHNSFCKHQIELLDFDSQQIILEMRKYIYNEGNLFESCVIQKSNLQSDKK